MSITSRPLSLNPEIRAADNVGLEFLDLRQRCQAIHIRHFDIEQNNIGIFAFEHPNGHRAVTSRGDDADSRFGFKNAGKKPTDNCGIVDNHDLDIR